MGKRLAKAATAAGNVAKRIGRAAKAAVNQIATAVEHATAPAADAPSTTGAAAVTETISSDAGGDSASDPEDDPARLGRLRATLDSAEAEEEERQRRELADSRRLSAVLDAVDDDLALPREPDGLLEPRESGDLED